MGNPIRKQVAAILRSVRKGTELSKVAKRFGLTVPQVERIVEAGRRKRGQASSACLRRDRTE
jgi:hypothetical protein